MMYTEDSEIVQQMLTEARLTRFRQVIDERLGCLTAVYENIYDPHNILACVRTAECFGISRVFVVADEALLRNEKISKYADRWLEIRHFENVQQLVSALRQEGFTLAGTVLEGEVVAHHELSLPPKLAVVFGNEKDGLSPEIAACCDYRLTIPMFGFTQSLNLSVASAILLQYYANAYREQGGDIHLPEAERRQLVDSWCDRDMRKKAGFRHQ